MQGVKGEELVFTIGNKREDLRELFKSFKDNHVEIRALHISEKEGGRCFNIITSDNNKASKIVSYFAREITRREVIIVELPARNNHLYFLIMKFEEIGIDVQYLYGSTSPDGKFLDIVFSSSNNEKALKALAL